MKQGLTYDDVLLKPQYSDILSRKEVDLATDLGKGIELRVPIIACLLYTSPSPRDVEESRMPSSA